MQDSKPTMEEMDSIIREIKAGSPLSCLSSYDVETDGTDPQKGALNAAIAHSAANKH